MRVSWHGDTCAVQSPVPHCLVSYSQAESLLRELQARVTLRTTPRKSSKKRFDFSVWRSPDEGVRTSPMLLRKQEHKEETKERGTMEGAEAPDRLPLPGKSLLTHLPTQWYLHAPLTPACIPTTSSNPHTLTPAHIPLCTPSILTPSTCTYTHHTTTPSHPHTLTPAHIPTLHALPSLYPHTYTYPPHPPILIPSHLHIYPLCTPFHPYTLTPAHIP